LQLERELNHLEDLERPFNALLLLSVKIFRIGGNVVKCQRMSAVS